MVARHSWRRYFTTHRVHLVTSQAQAEQISSEYLKQLHDIDASVLPALALDCEGVRLGRFGRICLMQMQDQEGRVMLCDALRPGIMEAFRPLLESPKILKARGVGKASGGRFHIILTRPQLDKRISNNL